MSAGCAVSADRHGTITGYSYGCRCDSCKRAAIKAAHHSNVVIDCSEPIGEKGSRCQQLLARLQMADNEVTRLARLANRSPAAFRKYREQLEAAKSHRQEVRATRDAHVVECDGAAARWAS